MKVIDFLKSLNHYHFKVIITSIWDKKDSEKHFFQHELLELWQMYGDYEIKFILNSTKYDYPNLHLILEEN